MRHRFLSVFLLLGTATLGAVPVDLDLLKRNTRIFERIVDEVVRQNFPNPFALTGTAEGVYLQDYGVVVSFHLNLNRGKIRTPFGEISSRPKDDRSKQQQLEDLKQAMVKCLADYGDSFKQLSGQERITISIHAEDRNELDPALKTTVMLISSSKENVERRTLGKISFEQFQEKVEIVEY